VVAAALQLVAVLQLLAEVLVRAQAAVAALQPVAAVPLVLVQLVTPDVQSVGLDAPVAPALLGRAMAADPASVPRATHSQCKAAE
jgi:hypothetical protein